MQYHKYYCPKCHTQLSNEDEFNKHSRKNCIKELAEYNKNYQQEFFRDM